MEKPNPATIVITPIHTSEINGFTENSTVNISRGIGIGLVISLKTSSPLDFDGSSLLRTISESQTDVVVPGIVTHSGSNVGPADPVPMRVSAFTSCDAPPC